MMENLNVKRGQIWYVKYNDAVGFEEAVGRPGVVVSEPTEENPLVTMVWLTTTPKSGGTVVEMSAPRKRSWAMCHHIITVDKSRFLQVMCDVPESEMLKIDVALRKVLKLPVRDNESAEKLIALEDKIAQLEDKIAELEVDNVVYKRIYGKAIEKIVDLKLEKDTTVKPVIEESVCVEEPVKSEVIDEPLDLSGLKEKFKVYDERLKVKKVQEEVPKKRIGPKVRKEFEVANINTHNAETIHEKTGIGLVTCKEIVSYRRKNGPYKEVSDLLNLKRFNEGCFYRYAERLEV